MTERYQQPFEEFLQPGAFLPVVVIKGFRVFQALVKMTHKLAIKVFVLAKQANFMLITETPVIEIG